MEYLSKLVANDWLNCVAKSLREQTISYGISQTLFHLTELRYQPKLMKISEFQETYIVNSSTKYHWFLLYRSKAIRNSTMETDFPAQLTVYIHPKILRFWHFFYWVEFYVSDDCEKTIHSRKLIFTHTKLFFQALKWQQNETCASFVSRAIAV